jgi:hypothetical protein
MVELLNPLQISSFPSRTSTVAVARVCRRRMREREWVREKVRSSHHGGQGIPLFLPLSMDEGGGAP